MADNGTPDPGAGDGAAQSADRDPGILDALIFFARHKRYDQWQAIPEAPIEDWLELLDSVRRRINRRLLQPKEEARVAKRIHELFPEAEFE